MSTTPVETTIYSGKGAIGFSGRIVLLTATSVLLLLYWASSAQSPLRLASLTGASVLLFLCAREVLSIFLKRRRARQTLALTKEFLSHDTIPALLCDPLGRLIWVNDAAQSICPDWQYENISLGGFLADHVTSAEQLIRRIRTSAQDTGFASEKIIGEDVEVTLHLRLSHDHEVWRLEVLPEGDSAENLSSPSLLLGRKGVVLSMNLAARTLVGRRAKSVNEMFRGEPLRDAAPIPLMTTDGEVMVTTRHHDMGAGRVRLELSPVPSGTVNDIGSLDDLPLPALMISAQGIVVKRNTLAETLFGEAGITGANVSSIVVGIGKQVDEVIAQTIQDGGVRGPEIFQINRGETDSYVQMTMRRVLQGGEPHLVAVLSDATELKSLEAQFVQGQKMQAIGQLAGGVAHDFNNLLTAISGHCDLMLLRHDQGDQDYADLIQIHQNANRAAALVTQLLAFSRQQTLQPEHLDLRDTLSDLTHLLNRLVGEKVTLMLSHDPVLRPIRADKRQLEQVIMNLVVNARDAMPDGGQISIETESVTLTKPLRRDRVTVP